MGIHTIQITETKRRIRNYLVCLLTCAVFLIPLLPAYSEIDFHIYSSKFFSIKYPSTWHVKYEQGISTAPGTSGVTLTKNGTNFSGVAVTVAKMPFTPEQVDALMDRSFSEKSIIESGDHFISSNSTYLGGFSARSVTYTHESAYFFTVISAYKDRLYEVGYGGPIDKYQDDLQEVKAIIDSFEIKR